VATCWAVAQLVPALVIWVAPPAEPQLTGDCVVVPVGGVSGVGGWVSVVAGCVVAAEGVGASGWVCDFAEPQAATSSGSASAWILRTQ
jgi:hypothetical protein